MNKETLLNIKYKILNISKNNFLFFFFLLSFIYLELAYRVLIGINSFNNFIFPFIYAICLSSIIYLSTGISNQKVNRIISIVLFTISGLVYSFYYVYYRIFKTTFSLFSFTGAKDVLEFKNIIFSSIIRNIHGILILFIPLVLFLLIIKKIDFSKKSNKIILSSVIIFAFSFTLSLIFINSTKGKPFSQYELYYKTSSPDLSVNKLGLVTTIRLDLQRTLFGMNPNVKTTLADNDVEENNPTLNQDNETYTIKIKKDEGKINIIDPINEDNEDNEIIRPKPSDNNEPPEVIGYNEMNIDFEKLINNENDPILKDMHKYFSSIESTKKNKYTGLFEGDNLILITAEAFSPYAVVPDLMPTLHNMINTSFVFSNFYTPLFGVSTSDGEYVECTSILPKQGVWSFAKSSDNLLPFVFGNQFSELGYKTMAYHNHSYKYYDRHLSHPNMGYEYKAVGNGLDIQVTWPESDLEMIEVSSQDYIDSSPFHVYYLTVSGHLEYNNSNYIAEKNKKYVEDLPYSKAAKAYIACNLELEFALKKLIALLEEENELDKTVIALGADHYPYGLAKSSINELAGHEVENNFELYKSNFLLWKKDTKTITIDKPCDSLDINPTLSNLFGLEYDSRLLIGSDMLSDDPGLVIFNNRSWITDKGRYNSITDKFISSNPNEDVPLEYINNIHKKVSDKFYYSAKILETDYYRSIFKEENGSIILR